MNSVNSPTSLSTATFVTRRSSGRWRVVKVITVPHLAARVTRCDRIYVPVEFGIGDTVPDDPSLMHEGTGPSGAARKLWEGSPSGGHVIRRWLQTLR